MTLPESVLKRAAEWTNPPYDENCRNEIKELIKNKNEKELNERFAVELEFGTGGIERTHQKRYKRYEQICCCQGDSGTCQLC